MKLRELRTKENIAKQNLDRLGGYDFHRMKLYLRDMRSMMIRESAKITRDHKTELQKYPQEAQMIDEVYFSRLIDHESTFVGLLLNSALVTSASLFEVMFKRVCKFAAYKTHGKFIEPRQQVFEKCQSFIKSLKIDLAQIDEEWKKLELMLNVRHLITHQGAVFKYEKAVFDPREKAVIHHIKSSKFIQIKHPRSKNDKQFFISDNLYINDFLDQSRDYLLWIIMQLPERRVKGSNKHRKSKN